MKIKANFRVIVIPDSFTSYPERNAKELMQSIKRHCDIDDCSLDYDMVCSFCGANWDVYTEDIPEEKIKKGLPACCTKAQVEWEKEQERG